MKMNGGLWLVLCWVIYATVAIFNHFVYKFTEFEYIELAWVIIMSMPLFIRPMADWCNIRVLWDN